MAEFSICSAWLSLLDGQGKKKTIMKEEDVSDEVQDDIKFSPVSQGVLDNCWVESARIQEPSLLKGLTGKPMTTPCSWWPWRNDKDVEDWYVTHGEEDGGFHTPTKALGAELLTFPIHCIELGILPWGFGDGQMLACPICSIKDSKQLLLVSSQCHYNKPDHHAGEATFRPAGTLVTQWPNKVPLTSNGIGKWPEKDRRSHHHLRSLVK